MDLPPGFIMARIRLIVIIICLDISRSAVAGRTRGDVLVGENVDIVDAPVYFTFYPRTNSTKLI